MDSLTQIVLGGAVAAAIAPPGHRRAALLAGAALGTLPDLDALWLGFTAADPVATMVDHRSFSHSLLVLPWVAALIWWGFRRFGKGRVAQAPVRWFWAIQLALVTHPLLDALTVYGTQLWWPLRPHPAMGSSVFIIDPAYTAWLLLGCVLAWFGRARPWAGTALGVALLMDSPCGFVEGAHAARPSPAVTIAVTPGRSSVSPRMNSHCPACETGVRFS